MKVVDDKAAEIEKEMSGKESKVEKKSPKDNKKKSKSKK
jgi:hypothetical protein